MPSVRAVRNQIERVEGFAEVVFADERGRTIRWFRMGMPRYPWNTPAPDDWTFADWKRERFYPVYGNLMVYVHAYDFHLRSLAVTDSMKLSFMRGRSYQFYEKCRKEWKKSR